MLYQELFRAVHEQDQQMIARLVRQGISPDTIDAYGEPVLLIAARLERPQAVTALLDCGANPGARGPTGACLLHYLGAYPDNLCLLGRALDECELDIDATDNEGKTPLMQAVIRGCMAGARALLNLGANPLKRDRHGASVIFHFVAGIYGFRPGEDHGEQLDLLHDLIDQGIDPDAEGPAGRTALSVAAEKGLMDVIEVLLEAGAHAATPAEAVNPVRAAALADQPAAAERLIDAGGALDWFSALALNRLDAARLMLDADPGLKDASEPESRVCSLAIAISHGNKAMARLLIERGADVNGSANQGTCLHQAIQDLPDPEFVELLIHAGADLNSGDGDWNTPLNFAARDDRLDLARVLLEQGADPNVETERGYTPLVFATSEEMRELIRHYGGH